MRQQRLHQGWTCEAIGPDALIPDELRGRAIYASVPGSLYDDLRSAWLIPDPLRDQNARALGWVAQLDWRYRAPLAPAPGFLGAEVLELAFEGLDGAARVTLDGALLGEPRDMFLPARFDLSGRVGRGPHELAVELASPLRPAEGDGAPRRAACGRPGWEGGPALPAGGLWGSVQLLAWSRARLGAWTVCVLEASAERARVLVSAQVVAAPQGGAGRLRLGLALLEPDTGRRWELGREVEPGLNLVEIEVEQPARWWPRGLGGAPLYALWLQLTEGEEVLERRGARVGLRVVGLDAQRGALSVNGRELFCKGAGWLPDSAHPYRARGERVRRRLAQAALAGVEVLHVLGGGLYESDDFYDACDELGLLVWQDFAACAPGAASPAMRARVEAEARYHVARLSPHPSLALWCAGDVPALLAQVVAQLDPSRPYLPSVAGEGPSSAGKLVARLDPQGAATWATWREALRAAPSSPDEEAVRHRLGPQGEALRALLAARLPEPDHWEAWCYAAQLLQAHEIERLIFEARAQRPRRAGVLLGRWNEVWAGVSGAAVDAGERPKLAWYAVRRAFAPRLLGLAPSPTGEGLGLCAINDGPQPWEASATVARLDREGRALAQARVPLLVPVGEVAWAPLPEALRVPGEPRREFLLAQAAGAARVARFFVEDKDFLWEPARWSLSVSRSAGGLELRLEAGALLRGVALDASRLGPGACAEDGGVEVMPGEVWECAVLGAPDGVGAAQVEGALLCVNALGRAR